MSKGTENDLPPIDPEWNSAEREELACLDYHLRRVQDLDARKLIPAQVRETMVCEAEARRVMIRALGLARAAKREARRLAGIDPEAALEWAGRASMTLPDDVESWSIAIEILRRIRDLDRALAVCAMATERFPGFLPTPDDLRRELSTPPSPDIEEVLRLARDALDRKDDARVLGLCQPVLEVTPDHFDSLVLVAFACQRLGRLDEALKHYTRLRELQPGIKTWRSWVDAITLRLQKAANPPGPATCPEPIPDRLVASVVATPHPTASPKQPAKEHRPFWGEVARQFLEDHWQKLILCLAVLLIVVSSNLGAYQLLGPRLWSPAGKCLLALVYSAMFAFLGIGLARWGAIRAGRIMLLTTLIIVPANFMLIGQMRLLTDPSTWRLAVLMLDSAALLALIRAVAKSLELPSGGGLLATALFALGVFNIAVPPAPNWPWSWTFGAFLAPALVLLGATVRITSRRQISSDSSEDQREVVYFALGALAFTFATGMFRMGIFALDLHPALYALPVMLSGVSAIVAGRRAPGFDPEPAHAGWLKLAGLALSGVAVALAMAGMAGSGLHRYNVLATALLGLGLYSTSLILERRPPYLYMTFGAIVLAYFSAYLLVAERARPFFQAAARMLGYSTTLPEPFLALNGLVLSTVLGQAALVFRRLGEVRLERHAHFIGVPLAVALCSWSAMEPKAAVLTMSGYALLFGSAVPLFRSPRAIYFATSALAGAAFFGSTLLSDTTVAIQGLMGTGMGLGCWLIGAALGRRETNAEYSRALDISALALSTLGSAGACLGLLTPPDQISPFSGPALLIAAFTAMLSHRRTGDRRVGYFAGIAANGGFVFAGIWACTWWRSGLTIAEVATAVALPGLIGTLLGRNLLSRRGDKPHEYSSPWTVYPEPLFLSALVDLALAFLLIALGTLHALDTLPIDGDYAAMALALGICGVTLYLLGRPYPSLALAHLSAACGLGVFLCLFQHNMGGDVATPSAYAAVASCYALLLLGIEESLRAWTAPRRLGTKANLLPATLRPETMAFARAIPWFELVAVLGAVLLCIVEMRAGLPTVLALGAGSTALLWSTRPRPSEPVVDLAWVLAACSASCLTIWSVGWHAPGLTLAWLAVSASISALVAWSALRFTSPRPGMALYVDPAFRATLSLALVAYGLALIGSAGSGHAYRVAILALALGVVVLGLVTATMRWATSTYLAIFYGVSAVYIFMLHASEHPDPRNAYILGLAGAIQGIGLNVLGLLSSSRSLGRDDDGQIEFERIYRRPAFVSALWLTVLSIVPAYRAPWTMVVVGLSFLTMVRTLPSPHWLYPALGSLACSIYHGFLARQPIETVATYAVLGGYALWLAGLMAGHWESAILRLFRLPTSGIADPFFRSAIVTALAAADLRLVSHVNRGLPWSDSWLFLLEFAGLCILMVKPYPSTLWVDVAAGLTSLAAGLAAASLIKQDLWWLGLGNALALGWLGLAQLIGRLEGQACERFAIRPLGYAARIEQWARVFSRLTLVVCSAIVIISTLVALLELDSTRAVVSWSGWWGVVTALVLGITWVVVRWQQKSWVEGILELELLSVLAVWWLGSPASPLSVRLWLDPRAYLPLATAASAAAVAMVGLRMNRPARWAAIDGSEERSDRFELCSRVTALVLSALGGLMTRAEIGIWPVAALSTAIVAPAILAVARSSIGSGYQAGLTACAAGIVGALELARRVGDVQLSGDFAWAACGLILATGMLWLAAGLMRPDSIAESREPGVLPAETVPISLEQVALVGALIAACLAWASPGLVGRQSEAEGWGAVGVFVGVSLLAVGLVARWGSEWLIYLAHGALVGGLLCYRRAFPLPPATDAVVLSALGFLDLGLADIMHRVGLSRFSRPTRLFSLALPILPLTLVLGERLVGGQDLSLFVLFSVASFYGIACATMQWKALGYSAGLFYNAFLWMLWGRFGWNLVDASQFYLVPVGLSTVLFAEFERVRLGRAATNAVRGLGMSLVYLSLVMPTWQFQSLGAWAALLFLSLAGVFVGIGLRVQVFLWLGLVAFILDVIYQLGRVGAQHTLAKWAIMLAVGIFLVMFVALNEKKRIVATMRDYFDLARQWD